MRIFGLKWPLIGLILIIFLTHSALAAKDIIKLIKEVTTSASEIWNTSNDISRESNNMALILLSRFDAINKDIKFIWERNSTAVNNTMNPITTRYRELEDYVKHQGDVESSTLLKFAEWTVSPNGFSVHHVMDRLHLIMFGADDAIKRRNTSVFETMAFNYGDEYKCLNQQSTQQFIYSLYTDIALMELKAYIMLEFSWSTLRAFGKGNFTQEAGVMRNNYKKRTEKTVRLLREIMQSADRQIWRCDPDNHVEGKTYEEVTRLLQGYIENEVDMSVNRECTASCSAYGRTKNEGCYMDQFCAKQERCTGQIYDCTYQANSMRICPSPLEDLRRYEYVQYDSVTAGRKSSCARGEAEALSWFRYIFWECNYCYCLCDDENSIKTDRYFNLRETLSNINENKVITGLRFAKENRVFHLQIQEGQLLARGVINASSVVWQPIDNYTLNESGVNKNQDYYTLTYDNRDIDLDVIEADDKDYVLTGVRFRVVEGHLNLQARLSQFDFESGHLLNPQRNSYWKSNIVRAHKRSELQLKDADIPINSPRKSQPDSGLNQYLKFSPTSFEKDVAQTTIPFIDVQNVISVPAVPLSGIGLYHKGEPGFGGFIAPKIVTFDFAPHMNI